MIREMASKLIEFKWSYLRKPTILIAALLVAASLFYVSMPQNAEALMAPFQSANTPIGGSNYYEGIAGLPFHPRAVDVNSKGHVFSLSYDQDVWRSTDNGATWAKVLDDGQDWSDVAFVWRRNILLLFVDSNDHIFVNIRSIATGKEDLYRSTDNGDSWAIVLVNSLRKWHMDEALNGSLWVHTYTGPGYALIYKSVDQGATWEVFSNLSMITEDLRTIAVNDYNDNEVWVATSRRVMYWNGSSWITMYTNPGGTSQSYVSSIWFDPKYVYLGAEYLAPKRANWRYPHAPIPDPNADLDYYWDPDKLPYVPDEHSFCGLRVNDIMLFGSRSQLWGSWDGNRWIKIVDFGDSTASDIESISQRRPIYFVDKKAGKLYRLSITIEDLVQLYHAEFLKCRGTCINNETYVAEYRMVNGTNEVDLTSVALTKAQASIMGLGRKNYFNNSGFETGSTVGWAFSGEGIYSVSSIDSYEGTYSLNIVKGPSDTSESAIWQSYIPVSRGEILTLSAWVKANVTLTKIVRLGLRNQTSGYWAYYPGSARGVQEFNVTTSWTRIKLYFAVNSPDVSLCAEFHALKGATYELSVDGLQLEKREVEIIRQETNADSESIEHLQYTPSPYFADTINTLNPSIAIAGQTVTHLGTITNGTESATTNLSGTMTGAVKVDANIEGSGQAILKINGTRVLYEDSIVLQGRKDDVYYGRYYGTFSPTITSTDLIAVTSLQSNITALSYTLNELTLTIDSIMGTISTTLVYVDEKGEPASVSGATAWSYNSETKIFTANIIHAGPQQTTLHWYEYNPPTTTIHLSGIQGSNGWFTSNVEVTLSASDDISGVDKTEYSLDNAIWIVYTRPFSITDEGKTTIYYRSTDKDGNQENTKAESIQIDQFVPSGSVTISSGSAYTTSTSVTLTLTASDATSGVSQVRYGDDGVWDTEPWETLSPTKAWTLKSGDGAKTVYYQVKDNAGLVSSTYSDTIVLDTIPPTGSITINEGAAYTNATTVTLSLSATDQLSGIAEICLSNDNITWTNWESYAASKDWVLTTSEGIKRIYVRFRDDAGLVSECYEDAIILDTTRPSANAGSDETMLVGEIVGFDAKDSSDNIGIIAYHWDFGDGNQAVGRTAAHTYNSPGIYTTTLTVKDVAGNTASHSITITVLLPGEDDLKGDGSSLWIIGIVVAAIGIVIAFALFRTRRKRMH